MLWRRGRHIEKRVRVSTRRKRVSRMICSYLLVEKNLKKALGSFRESGSKNRCGGRKVPRVLVLPSFPLPSNQINFSALFHHGIEVFQARILFELTDASSMSSHSSSSSSTIALLRLLLALLLAPFEDPSPAAQPARLSMPSSRSSYSSC